MKLTEKIAETPEAGRDIIIIFVVAIILRVVFMLLMAAKYTPLVILNLLQDSGTYIDVARYLLGVNVAGADDLLLTGPGYGFFLAVVIKLFGFTAWPVLIIQAILSSLSCVFIYKISQLLLDNRKISLIAGILAATSLTSISLSAAVLTETIFFFLLVVSIYFYFKGAHDGSWIRFILAGLLLGLATLVRSVGLFFPVVIILIALVYPIKSNSLSRGAFFIRAIVMSLVIIVVALPWALKNKNEHGIFTVSETGILAARNYLGSRVIYEAESRTSLIKIRDWMASPKEIEGRPETALERHQHAVAVVKTTFSRYTGTFIKVFLTDIWENIGSMNTIHSLQVPQLRGIFSFYTDKIGTKGKSYLVFYLTIIGFVLLMLEGRKREAIVLGVIFIYFAFLSGFTYWQGSRIFFPGQVTWTIFVAVALYQIGLAVRKIYYYLKKA